MLTKDATTERQKVADNTPIASPTADSVTGATDYPGKEPPLPPG